jgi:hypothetical protein
MVRFVSVSATPAQLVLETSWFPNQPPALHSVSVTGTEVALFQHVLSSRPFGFEFEHNYSLESLSSSNSCFKCNLRVSFDGSRQRDCIEISGSTHAGLQAVLDTNIISEGYVRG